MAAITWTDVTNFDSTLSAVAADARTDILAFVNALSVTDFGGESAATTKIARIMLAAHLGVSVGANAGGAAGVASESAGGLSRSYFAAAASGDALEATSYGRHYKWMRRVASGGPRTV